VMRNIARQMTAEEVESSARYYASRAILEAAPAR